MLGIYLDKVRSVRPIIHSITNYVTAGDCANMLIACGASPIMADEPEEVSEITSRCSGLNINMGTLNTARIESMVIAGKRSNELGHPVVLDPVGVGGSRLRIDTAARLLGEVRFAAIKGNISEIKCLARGEGAFRGVDADGSDLYTGDGLEAAAGLAKELSAKTGAVVIITGPVDIAAGPGGTYFIYNGHPMMSSVSGTGCQLSAMTAAFIAASPKEPLKAAAAAVCAMGLAGETAHARLTEKDGNASYRNYMIDAVWNMTSDQLEKGARYEIR